MKTDTIFSFLIVCGIPLYLASRNTYKKLVNKKLMSNESFYEKVNFFICFNKCEKQSNCKIFNYNEKHEICQLSNKEVDESSNDVTQSSG